MDKCLIILVIILGVQTSYIVSKPLCPKFDYERKMIEKVISGEIKMDRMSGDIDNVKNALTKMNMDIDAKIESLSTMLNGVNERVTSLSQDFEQRKIEVDMKMLTTTTPAVDTSSSVVAFSAKDIAGRPFWDVGSTVNFSNVEYNEGDGYDSTTGIFNAPKSGWYLFVVSICPSHGYHYSDRFFILNDDNHISTVKVPSRSDTPICYSKSVFTKVTSGHEVKVEYGREDVWYLYNQYQNTDTMFSGILLFEV